MTISILIALVLGIGAGFVFVPEAFSSYNEFTTSLILSLLLFFVGIDIGQNKHIFKDLKRHSYLMLLIPSGIIIGSLLGGLATALIFNMPLNLGTAISAGFGWYSLSGIMLTKLHSAEIGTIAFLTNVVREVLAIVSIPFLAKYLNKFTAIAPAGATSMDTTLPLISSCTNEEVAVIAFINGVILSSLVPLLVPLLYAI